MKVGKPKSKRTPVRLRHKIEKASNAKQRKQRKEAKKNPQWRSRVKKDPGIPNLFPYKGKLLAEVEENKRRKEEEQMRRREIAKAQREGRAVGEVDATNVDEEGDEILLDEEEESGSEDGDMEVEGSGSSSNPMAALLASAQARADAHTQDDQEDDDSEENEEEEHGEIGITNSSKTNKSIDSAAAKQKGLPKAALEDPIRTCTKLLEQMQQTQDGMLRLIEHYQIPPLVTAGSDLTTRFLVEVARKRGRLGRGGVPNLHSAALTVLGDVYDGRMVLPAVNTVDVERQTRKSKERDSVEKSQVTVVGQMAEPFRIEGLWGEGVGGAVSRKSAMVVEP